MFSLTQSQGKCIRSESDSEYRNFSPVNICLSNLVVLFCNFGLKLIHRLSFIYRCLFQKFCANLLKSNQTVPVCKRQPFIFFLNCVLDKKTGRGGKHTSWYSSVIHKKNVNDHLTRFLAHLSTECSVSYCDYSPSVGVRPSVRPQFLVNTLASTNINQSSPNLVKIYMTTRARMRSVMKLIGPEVSELSALELENLPYVTMFSL